MRMVNLMSRVLYCYSEVRNMQQFIFPQSYFWATGVFTTLRVTVGSELGICCGVS
jgi:hypothetical protein